MRIGRETKKQTDFLNPKLATEMPQNSKIREKTIMSTSKAKNSLKTHLNAISILTTIILGFMGSANGQEITAKGVFETYVLDFPVEKGKEIAKQRALANAAKQTGKYVEVNERLLQTNQGSSTSKDIAVLSAAILLEKSENSQTQQLGDRVRFETEVVVEFEDKQAKQFEQYLQAMEHQTKLMLDLNQKQDELAVSQLKLEQMVGKFKSEQVQAELHNNNQLTKALAIDYQKANAIISPLVKASLQKQMQLIDETKINNARQAEVQKQKQVEETRNKQYIENMQAVGKGKLKDFLIKFTRTEVAQVKLNPTNQGYDLTTTLQFVTDALDSENICRLVETFHLGKNCQVKQTTDLLTLTFDEGQPTSFANDFLKWNIEGQKFTATGFEKAGQKISLKLSKQQRVLTARIDQRVYDKLKHNQQSLNIILE